MTLREMIGFYGTKFLPAGPAACLMLACLLSVVVLKQISSSFFTEWPLGTGKKSASIPSKKNEIAYFFGAQFEIAFLSNLIASQGSNPFFHLENYLSEWKTR